MRYRQSDLFGILALESVRNRTVIVGEDLGVVPDGFRETMAAESLCSCRLLWFERHKDGTYHRPTSTRATRWFPSPPTIWPRSPGSGPDTTC